MPRDSWLTLLDDRDESDPRHVEADREYDRDKRNEAVFLCSRRKGVCCPMAPGSRGPECHVKSTDCPFFNNIA